MRIILYSGKGGVGKTSLAAANAVAMAQAGHRTLVVSADPAHSLGDVLGTRLTHLPLEIAPNLFAREFAARDALQAAWSKVGAYLEAFLQSQGLDPIAAAEIAAMPGIADVLVMAELAEWVPDYDVILLDCAPTGATATLLAIPDAIRWYMQRFFPIERALMRTIKPLAEKFTAVPLPSDEVFGQISSLHERIERTAGLLRDKAITTLRLVATGDEVVLAETRRALSKFRLFQLHVDAIIVNRLFPDHLAAVPELAAWVQRQQAHLKVLPQEVYPTPVFPLRHWPTEPVGLPILLALGQDLPMLRQLEPLSKPQPPNLRWVADSTPPRAVWTLPVLADPSYKLWVDGDNLVFMDTQSTLRYPIPEQLQGARMVEAKWLDNSLEAHFVRQ